MQLSAGLTCVCGDGGAQTALYLDFFYTYINAKRERIDAPIELDAV